MRDSVGNGFLIREFPVRPLNEGEYVMDYDMPELVVFIYEDYHHRHFVKDICICRVDSTKGTMETVSPHQILDFDNIDSNSNGSSEFAPHQDPCIKDLTEKEDSFGSLMMEGEVEHGFEDGDSIDDKPAKKRTTSEAQGEIIKNDDYSRSFSFKHWQFNSFLGRIGNRVESQHCAELLSRPQIVNSQTLTSSTKSFEQQTDNHPEQIPSTIDPRMEGKPHENGGSRWRAIEKASTAKDVFSLLLMNAKPFAQLS